MSERHETLAIRNLRLDVAQSGNDIVDEVTLTIARGEMLGLVGESGSGKTTVGLAVLSLALSAWSVLLGLGLMAAAAWMAVAGPIWRPRRASCAATLTSGRAANSNVWGWPWPSPRGRR